MVMVEVGCVHYFIVHLNRHQIKIILVYLFICPSLRLSLPATYSLTETPNHKDAGWSKGN